MVPTPLEEKNMDNMGKPCAKCSVSLQNVVATQLSFYMFFAVTLKVIETECINKWFVKCMGSTKYKNHINLYIQGTTIPCDIVHK